MVIKQPKPETEMLCVCVFQFRLHTHTKEWEKKFPIQINYIDVFFAATDDDENEINPDLQIMMILIIGFIYFFPISI